MVQLGATTKSEVWASRHLGTNVQGLESCRTTEKLAGIPRKPGNIPQSNEADATKIPQWHRPALTAMGLKEWKYSQWNESCSHVRIFIGRTRSIITGRRTHRASRYAPLVCVVSSFPVAFWCALRKVSSAEVPGSSTYPSA
jgi:hypothetical protein